MENSQNMASSEALTEEMMFVEFYLGNNYFCIPVKNVNEIIMPTKITPVPQSKSYIEGITDIRGEVLPVINLASFLSIPVNTQYDQDRFIVAELANQRVIFHVSGVEQIISVNNIEKPKDITDTNQYVKGIVRNQEHIALTLDFERMIQKMNE